jgi:hypothetical protein
MDIKQIASKFTPEQISMVMAACKVSRSVEDIKKASLAAGVELSEEEANYLAAISGDGKEVSDDDLDAVSGGCANPYNNVSTS